MMLVIRTQCYENYAWVDGELQTGPDAYWKAKGGREHKMLNVPLNVDYNELVKAADVESANDGYIETVIDWIVAPDDYLSWFEQSQMEYDGEIVCPEPVMYYEDVVNKMMVPA
jgi:hypothetical protein